jgi:integrase
MKRLLTKYLAPEYQSQALDTITARSLADTFKRRVKSRGELIHLHKVTKTFFRWAVKAQYVPFSPCEALEDPRKSENRERVLSKPAKVAVRAFRYDGSNFDAIVALLLLTGQRRAQIAGLRADMIDTHAGRISFPPYLMKNGKGHTIPLVGRAKDILEPLARKYGRGLLFPARGQPDVPFCGWSRVKEVFDKGCGVTGPGWTLHDLRRTFSTYCAELGEDREIVERILSHTVNTGGVRGIYDRYSYLPQMSTVLQNYSNFISDLVKSAPER